MIVHHDIALAMELNAICAREDEDGDIVAVIPIIYGFRLTVGDKTGHKDFW